MDSNCTMNMTMNMPMMPMYFEWNYQTVVLFQTWSTGSRGEYAAACIITFLIAAIWEAGRAWRVEFDKAVSKWMEPACMCKTSIITPSVVRVPIKYQLARSFIHLVHFTFAYLIMLIAMTFSGGLFLSIILGSTVGYYITHLDLPLGGASALVNAESGSCH